MFCPNATDWGNVADWVSGIGTFSFGGGDGVSRRVDLLDDIEGIRRQLDSLQQFPITDPRLFAEIGRTVYECRVEPEMPGKSTSYAAQIMTRVADRMRVRRDAIASL